MRSLLFNTCASGLASRAVTPGGALAESSPAGEMLQRGFTEHAHGCEQPPGKVTMVGLHYGSGAMVRGGRRSSEAAFQWKEGLSMAIEGPMSFALVWRSS
jgi:hypothetical protein